MYIYTTKKGKFIEIKKFGSSLYTKTGKSQADRALNYRKKLEKQILKPVVVWSHMGGDNPEI